MTWWKTPLPASRTWTLAGSRRLWDGWLRILEATLAATLAWLVAVHILGHGQPFFAPASALIVLGVTQGQRLQRAVEIVVGVAVGVLVADLITRALGPQTIWSVMTVTLLTLTAAIFVGGGPLLAIQATVSALYATVVVPPGSGLVPTRFVDALVGGALALIINQLPLHRNPMVTLLSEAGHVFDTLSAVLVDTADALAAHDHHAAQAALNRARGTDPAVTALEAALEVGQETLRLDPLRRRRRGLLRRYEDVTREVDYAARNVRVLARAVVALTREPTRPPAALAEALRQLALAVTALSADVTYTGETPPSARRAATGNAGLGPDSGPALDSSSPQAVEKCALGAVQQARSALTPKSPLPVAMIVWQVRSTAVDLLRGTGLELAAVLDAIDEALEAGVTDTGH
jgi:uncharacterized membrane protein YgaE (UPF0421/DUF939 family)